MRQALSQAVHYARHRQAFGAALIDQPLMRNVLADLALEVEAAIALAMRLAQAFDAQHDEAQSLLRRLLTPAGKFRICKRGAELAAEAMEVLGGNGYVEDDMQARIYREMPVNSIWEGSGNVMCLDVLRALGKNQRTADALMAELAPAQGRNAHFDAHLLRLSAVMRGTEDLQSRARSLTHDLVLAVQAALLLQHAPEPIAQAFCASRLGREWGGGFGTLPHTTDFDTLLNRALQIA
jgi:putative acyl-CoA dehydrogenase